MDLIILIIFKREDTFSTLLRKVSVEAVYMEYSTCILPYLSITTSQILSILDDIQKYGVLTLELNW